MTEPRNPLRILAPEGSAPTIMRELSRRRFLSVAAIAGSAAALAACAPSGNGSPKPQATGGTLEDDVSVYTWGDYDSPEVVSGFTSELGPDVTLDSYSSNEELIAKLIAAKGTSGYDIVVPTGVFIPQMIENGLLTPFNKDLLPNLANMDPAYLGRAWDPGQRLLGLQGMGHHRLRLRQERDHARARHLGRLLRRREERGERKDVDVGRPRRYHRRLLLGQRHGLEHRGPRRARGLPRLPGRRDRPAHRGVRLVPRHERDPAGHAVADAGVERRRTTRHPRVAASPTAGSGCCPGPITELWMDNWAIAAGAPHPEAAHAFINYSLSPESLVLNLDYIGYNVGGKDMEPAAVDAGLELTDLIFFTPEQLETMEEQILNDSQTTRVEIWNEMKAAAGA